jgi:hypothetical protein
MIVCCANQCAFCLSPIVSGQRWVREKIYDPALNGREPSYRRYHAEPFTGQEGSCWEKHQMEEEIARPTPTPLRRNTTPWEEKQLPILI